MNRRRNILIKTGYSFLENQKNEKLNRVVDFGCWIVGFSTSVSLPGLKLSLKTDNGFDVKMLVKLMKACKDVKIRSAG